MLPRITSRWRFLYKPFSFRFYCWKVVLFLIVSLRSHSEASPPRYSSRIVEIQSGAIRGVILELNSKYLEPVEVFRGVPYAAPPVGPYRFKAPQPPLSWPGTRLADSFGPVCPQNYPNITNRTEALLEMPKGRYSYLKKLLPLLKNQAENCLFLNIYVPGSGNRGFEAPYAVLVLIHGESFEWGGSHPYDGSVMASHGHVIFITLNYRLGVLGFLKTSTSSTMKESESFGIQDIAAALRWIQVNIAAFGGDSSRVTLIGEGTGAALVNLLLLSSQSKGLFRRVIFLSGTVLSPWATIRNPDLIRKTVGKQLGCLPPNAQYDNLEDIAACLRSRPLKAILDLKLEKLRFMPRIAPWTSTDPLLAMERTSNTFITSEIMLGVATTESYTDFNANDIQYGFEEDQRNRILRTYVRNSYVYHLNEIFSAVRNEYTDWEKPIPHPINLRDSVIEGLSDGHTVSPAIRVAYLHAKRGAKTYFFHFGYQSKGSDYPQRLGSVRGEHLSYLLGQPLVEGMPNFSQNYSKQDMGVSEALLIFVSNFAKTGDPNQPGFHKEVPDYGTPMEKTRYRGLIWDPYETGTQYYLSLTQKPKIKSHYRGHKMALWLNLIPQLHQPGDDAVTMRHHHFFEKESHYYAGAVRSESYARPPARIHPGSMTGFQMIAVANSKTTTECLTIGSLANSILEIVGGNVTVTESESTHNLNMPKHWYSFSMLGLCLIIGFVLVLLNIIALTGIYFQISFEWRKDERRRSSNGSLNPFSNPTETTVNEEQCDDFEKVFSSYYTLSVTSPLNDKKTPQTKKSSSARKKIVQIQEVPLQSFTFGMPCKSHTNHDDGKNGDETMTLDLVSVRL